MRLSIAEHNNNNNKQNEDLTDKAHKQKAEKEWNKENICPGPGNHSGKDVHLFMNFSTLAHKKIYDTATYISS